LNKTENLKKILQDLGRVIVAYSGGLDSTFLLKMAIDTLGKDNVLAVTARSETYPLSEYKEARSIARSLGAKHLTINTRELNIKSFRTNPVNRCYYCKKELFKKLDEIKTKYKMDFVLDGTNFDDLKDVRYGRKAAVEIGVRSPLLEAEISKSEIRSFSKQLGLPTWDKPSFACLASRFPFGDTITKEDLSRVDEAESYLRKLGFRQIRVRCHGKLARIETLPQDLSRAIKIKEKIIAKLGKIGFVYVTLDLCGYRTGSMHEVV
jgi:pyridinium-3,5-biscarboxylic acid mononucleotide sulfurtransferase